MNNDTERAETERRAERTECDECDHPEHCHTVNYGCTFSRNLLPDWHCDCSKGRKELFDKLAERLASKATVEIIPPIRERIEHRFRIEGKTLGDLLLSDDEKLLRDALNEAETNFTLYQAWVKRATESELETASLRERLEAADEAIRLLYGGMVEGSQKVADYFNNFYENNPDEKWEIF